MVQVIVFDETECFARCKNLIELFVQIVYRVLRVVQFARRSPRNRSLMCWFRLKVVALPRRSVLLKQMFIPSKPKRFLCQTVLKSSFSLYREFYAYNISDGLLRVAAVEPFLSRDRGSVCTACG